MSQGPNNNGGCDGAAVESLSARFLPHQDPLRDEDDETDEGGATSVPKGTAVLASPTVVSPTSIVPPHWPRWRCAVRSVVSNALFERFIFLIIILNCVTIGSANFSVIEEQREIIDYIEDAFTIVFLCEVAAKIVAYGVFVSPPAGYFASIWNVLDFVVVGVSVVGLVQQRCFSGGNQVTAVIGVRVLRPLRTVSNVTSLRVILETIAVASRRLVHVVILAGIYLVVMGLVAMAFFSGKMSSQCRSSAEAAKYFNCSAVDYAPSSVEWEELYRGVDGDPICVTSGFTADAILPQEWPLCGNATEVEGLLFASKAAKVVAAHRLPSDSGPVICPFGSLCVTADTPERGYTNYEWYVTSLATLYSITAFDGWTFVMYLMMDVRGFEVSWYTLVVVIVGNTFVLNLILVVIADSFNRATEIAKKQQERRLAATPKPEASSNPAEATSPAAAEATIDEAAGKDQKPNGGTTAVASAPHPSSSEQAGWCPAVHDYVTSQPWFASLTMVIIFVNTSLMALTHHGMPSELAKTIQTSNFICALYFACEVALKLVGERPAALFGDALNTFDVAVTAAAIAEIIWTSDSQLSVFRSVRLLRVVSVIPSLRRTVNSLVRALKSSVALLALFFVVLMLFSLGGMQLLGNRMSNLDRTSAFRVKTHSCTNVPRFNFDNLYFAFLTLFVASAGDGWRNMMTAGEAAVGKYGALFFLTFHFVGIVLVNLFVAVMLGNRNEEEEDDAPEGEADEDNDNGGHAIEVGPSEAAFSVAKEEMRTITDMSAGGGSNSNSREEPLLGNGTEGQEPESVQVTEEGSSLASEKKGLARRKGVLKLVGRAVMSRGVDRTMTVIIAVSMIVMAFHRPTRPPDHATEVLIERCGVFFTCTFIVEAAVKMIHFGVFQRRDQASHKAYFASKWNTLDFVMMLCTAASSTFWLSGVIALQPAAAWLRLARAFRPWSILGRHESLGIVFRSLVRSVVALRNVAVVMLLVTLVFAILGTQLFNGSFYACTDERWGDASFHPSGPQLANRTACLQAGYRWTQPDQSFDHLGLALITLFQLATVSDWHWMMYTASDSVDYEHAPQALSRPFAPLYFIAFVITMSFFLSNMFTAVLVENYYRTSRVDQQRRIVRISAKRNTLLTDEQRDFVELYRRALLFFHPPLHATYSTTSWRHKLRPFVRSSWFEVIQLALVVLHIGVEALELEDWARFFNSRTALWTLDVAFNVAFCVAAALKWYVYGTHSFLEHRRNVLDVLINVIAVAGDVLEPILPSNEAGRVMQLARLARLYRVMFLSTGVMLLLDTLMHSARSFAGVSLMLFLLLYSATVIAMKLFGHVRWGTDGRDGLHRWAQYDRFDIAMYTLVRLGTSDNWTPMMWACSCAPPKCSKDLGDCGNMAASIIFHVLYIIIGQWIGMRFFVAVLLDSFANAERQERFAVQRKDVERFSSLWKEHTKADEGSLRTMPLIEFQKFVVELGPPMGPNFGVGKPSFHTVLRLLSELDLPLHKGEVMQQDVFECLLRQQFGVALPPTVDEQLRRQTAERFRWHEMVRISPDAADVEEVRREDVQQRRKRATSLRGAAAAALLQSMWRGARTRKAARSLIEPRSAAAPPQAVAPSEAAPAPLPIAVPIHNPEVSTANAACEGELHLQQQRQEEDAHPV